MDRLDHRARIRHIPLRARVGDDDAAQILTHQLTGQVLDRDLQVDRPGPLRGDGEDLGVEAGVEKHPTPFPLRPRHEAHGLSGGGGLVKEGRVGDRQPRELGDHRLEVEQRLQTPLRDLRLIRRVRGVPARRLQHTAPDHRGSDRVRETLAVEGTQHRVALRVPTQPRLRLCLREGLMPGEWFREADVGGEGGVDKLSEGIEPQHPQHHLLLRGVRTGVPGQVGGGIRDRMQVHDPSIRRKPPPDREGRMAVPLSGRA